MRQYIAEYGPVQLYSRWRPWSRCEARGRRRKTNEIVRCELEKDHEGDCGALFYNAYLMRFHTMWVATGR